MNECYDNLPFLTYLFFLMSFIPCSVLLSSTIVAKFVYFPHLEKIKNEKEWSDEEEEEEEKEILYEDKYPLSETEEDCVSEKEVLYKRLTVIETTPDGVVVLKYSKEREGFEYWSDKKLITYKYLDTVARRFVLVFDCKNIYIDRNKNLKMKEQKRKEERANEKMKTEDKEEEQNSDDDLFVSKKSTNKTNKEEKIVADVANKYIYMGKVNDFDNFKQQREAINEKKHFSFSDFKEMAGL